MSIGLGDDVKVLGDESLSAPWLEATVVRVDKPNGLYCVARASSGGTFFVGLSQLRLVTKAGRRATTCAADAAFLKEIETWSEEKLRTMQDCLGEHDQHLVSLVRLRRNHDQQWGAVVARRRKLDEEWAAAAPARAARNKRKRERERAERARAPPPTRASHPTPAFLNRHLGHVGGKGVGIPRLGPPPQNPRSPSGGGGGPVVETGGDMPVTPTFLFSEAPVILDFEEWEALEHPPGGRDQ